MKRLCALGIALITAWGVGPSRPSVAQECLPEIQNPGFNGESFPGGVAPGWHFATDSGVTPSRLTGASFEGGVTALRRGGSGEYRASVQGTLSIHGVEKPRTIECTGALEGEELRVKCAFEVTLSDHEIPIPKLMFMKIDEVMALDLDLILAPVSGGESR